MGHTGAEGIRLKEGGHINKSLLTLGTVISKLSEGNRYLEWRVGPPHSPVQSYSIPRF